MRYSTSAVSSFRKRSSKGASTTCGYTDSGRTSAFRSGCNFCAGLISPRLNEILDECGLVLPEEIIQGRIDYVWIHGQWKNLRLPIWMQLLRGPYLTEVE